MADLDGKSTWSLDDARLSEEDDGASFDRPESSFTFDMEADGGATFTKAKAPGSVFGASLFGGGGGASMFGGGAASIFGGRLGFSKPDQEARPVDCELTNRTSIVTYTAAVTPQERGLTTTQGDLVEIYASVTQITAKTREGHVLEVCPRVTAASLILTGRAMDSTVDFHHTLAKAMSNGEEGGLWVLSVSSMNVGTPIPFENKTLDLRAVFTPDVLKIRSLPLAFLSSCMANILPSSATSLPLDYLRYYAMANEAAYEATSKGSVTGTEAMTETVPVLEKEKKGKAKAKVKAKRKGVSFGGVPIFKVSTFAGKDQAEAASPESTPGPKPTLRKRRRKV